MVAPTTTQLAVLAAWIALNRTYGVEEDAVAAEANLHGRQLRSGKYGTAMFEKWFRARSEWFSDPGDIVGMRWILKAILNGGVIGARSLLPSLRTVLSEAEAQNWYMRYAMFDPSMGMLNPDEARDFYLQRMTKRFNLLVLAIEEGAK